MVDRVTIRARPDMPRKTEKALLVVAALAAEKLKADGRRGCIHCEGEFRVNIEGENLCQRHADEWVRGEGLASREYDKKEE